MKYHPTRLDPELAQKVLDQIAEELTPETAALLLQSPDQSEPVRVRNDGAMIILDDRIDAEFRPRSRFSVNA